MFSRIVTMERLALCRLNERINTTSYGRVLWHHHRRGLNKLSTLCARIVLMDLVKHRPDKPSTTGVLCEQKRFRTGLCNMFDKIGTFQFNWNEMEECYKDPKRPRFDSEFDTYVSSDMIRSRRLDLCKLMKENLEEYENIHEAIQKFQKELKWILVGGSNSVVWIYYLRLERTDECCLYECSTRNVTFDWEPLDPHREMPAALVIKKGEGEKYPIQNFT